MSGSFGEMGNLLKQAQKMQAAMDEAREELKTTTVEGTAGGGVVRIVVTGDGRVEEVQIPFVRRVGHRDHAPVLAQQESAADIDVGM